MMVRPLAFVLPAMLAFSSPAAAQAVPAASAAPQKPAEKLVCHTDDVVGSRISKRKICMTAAQWRESSRNASEWMDKKTQEISKPGGG